MTRKLLSLIVIKKEKKNICQVQNPQNCSDFFEVLCLVFKMPTLKSTRCIEIIIFITLLLVEIMEKYSSFLVPINFGLNESFLVNLISIACY